MVQMEQNIYNIVFHEVIRQVAVNCAERGQLLAKLRLAASTRQENTQVGKPRDFVEAVSKTETCCEVEIWKHDCVTLCFLKICFQEALLSPAALVVCVSRQRYQSMLERIPRCLKALHTEALAQRTLNCRFTEEICRIKASIRQLSRYVGLVSGCWPR